MGTLRQARTARLAPHFETSCLGVYERELDYVCETLQRLGARSREIEDLAQAVFVTLKRRWAGLDGRRPTRAYLFGIAFRVVRLLRPDRVLEISEEVLPPSDSRDLLLTALQALPLSHRAVVIMHDLDGCALAEIAVQLSFTRFGAQVRLRHGRKELGSALRRLRGGEHRHEGY